MVTVRLGLGVVAEIARMNAMTTTALRAKYVDLFKQQPRSNNRSYLFKRLALKVQEPGGKTALESTGVSNQAAAIRDPRLPGVGAVLTKTYKGRNLKVLVTSEGFEFDGTRYRSLSAIARKLMGGTSINGYGFFGLFAKEGA